MAADRTKLRTWTLFIIVVNSTLFFTNVTAKTTCADVQCKEPVSEARAQVVYRARQDDFLSFPKDAKIVIYGKNAGKNNELWIGEFKGKRGFLPSALVRETKILTRNLLEIPSEEEDGETRASNNNDTSGQQDEKVESFAINSEDVHRNEEVSSTEVDEKPSNQNESVVSVVETQEEVFVSESSDVVHTSDIGETSTPDLQLFSDIIKDTWSSFKGTATLLSQPLESLQTLQNALSEHADKFSNSLFKGVMVSAEESEQPFIVSDGTTLHDNFEYPASEVEYNEKSNANTVGVNVVPSIPPLPSSTIGHRSTPDIPQMVSNIVNVSPTHVDVPTKVHKNEIKPSTTSSEIKPTEAGSSIETLVQDIGLAAEETGDKNEELSADEVSETVSPSEELMSQLKADEEEETVKSDDSWFGGLFQGDQTASEQETIDPNTESVLGKEDSYANSENGERSVADDDDEEEEDNDDTEADDVSFDDDDEDEDITESVNDDGNDQQKLNGTSTEKDDLVETEPISIHADANEVQNSEANEDVDKNLFPKDQLDNRGEEKNFQASSNIEKTDELKSDAKMEVPVVEKMPKKSLAEQLLLDRVINGNKLETPETLAAKKPEVSGLDQTAAVPKKIKLHEEIVSVDAEAKSEIPNAKSVDPVEDENNVVDSNKLPGLSKEALHKMKLEKAKNTYSNLIESRSAEFQNANLESGVKEPPTKIIAPEISSTASSVPVESTTEAEISPIEGNQEEQVDLEISKEQDQSAVESQDIKATQLANDAIQSTADASEDQFYDTAILQPADPVVKFPEVFETSVYSKAGFLPSAVGSQSVESTLGGSNEEPNYFENENVAALVGQQEESNDLVDNFLPKVEESSGNSKEETSDQESLFPDLQIMKSMKDFVDTLRPYVQLSIDILPDFIKLYLVELEHQGVSPRVMVFTIITGIFNLLFLIAYLIMKRRSQEERLIQRLCKLDKQLFEAVTEKEVVKDELKNSKSKFNNLMGNSSEAQEMIDMLNEELKESKTSRGKLQERVACLETQLETATEAGFELNTMLTNFLNSQNETGKLEESIAFLKDQLEQQTTLVERLHGNAEQTMQQHRKLEEDHDEAVSKIANLTDENIELKSSLEESEVTRSQVTEELKYIQNQVTVLEKSNSQLLEEAQVWNQRVQELQQQSELYQKSTEDLQETLTLKEGELSVLQDCMLQLKIIQDETSDDCSETPLEKLEKLMDVSRVTAEMKTISMEKNSLIERLNLEEGRSKKAEDQLVKVNDELEQLKLTKAALQEERDAACTKLQVLSNYFKEKEIELQRELGVQEAKRQETQETATSVTQQISTYEKDIATYKSQIKTLKTEIENQARSFKNQISQLETKAHDNWMATRAAERRSEDAKQEAAMLRNKLNLVEQEKQLDRTLGEGIVKPTPKRYAGSNGEIPSPPQLDSGPVDFVSPSGPSSLLREPLEPLPPHVPFLPQDRPLPPPPLGFPPPPLPPPYLRDRMPMLPPPFDTRGMGMPPFPPYDMPRRMPPLRIMPLPNRDRYSPPSSRITPPYDPNSPPPRDYRSPPPVDRWNAPPTPPFDRRPPSGRRLSPPPGRRLSPPPGRRLSPPPPCRGPPFDNRPFFPPNGRNPTRADRIAPIPQQEAHPPPHLRENFHSDNQTTPASDNQASPRSASSGEQDETTTAV